MSQLPLEEEKLAEMPLTEHLRELRSRLIRVVIVVLVLFLCLLPFGNKIYEVLSAPLRAQLPANSRMIATDVTATFLAPFKLNLFVAFLLAIPFILHQLWQFIAPTFYKREKRLAIPFILSSIILFYLGMAFAYFVTLPTILTFFVHAAPQSVAPMTDINSYLHFCLKIFLVFGATFEVPVVVLLLILAEITTVEDLAHKRRYVIVVCFFIAMLITPPDALSMTMLAVPMCLLFELGLLLGRWMK